MITTPSKTFLFHDNAVFISSTEPHRCRCGRMAYLFINRNGQSRCLFCDAKPLEFEPADPAEDPCVKQCFLGALV